MGKACFSGGKGQVGNRGRSRDLTGPEDFKRITVAAVLRKAYREENWKQETS